MKKALFIETLTRTRYTERWYEQRPMFEDNVATHSFRVAMFSLIVATLEEKYCGNKVDLEQVLCGAIFHDMNEVLTSTIKYGTKKNKEVEELVAQLEVEKNEEIVSWLPENMQDIFHKYLVEAENQETLEGQIVYAMDDFDAMMFCYREIKEGSKTPFFQITFDKLKNKMKKSELKSVQLLMSSIDLENGLYRFIYKVMNFSSIKRWMGRKNNVIDDDAIHTMTTTALGIYLANYENLNTNNKKIDIGRMAAKIICHDIPEIETGDIRGPVKHSSRKLKEAFAKIEEQEAEKQVQLIPPLAQENFIDYLVNAKSNDPEGKMVDIADKLEAFIKSTLEMRDNEFEYKCTYEKQKEKFDKNETRAIQYFMKEIHPNLMDPNVVKI